MLYKKFQLSKDHKIKTCLLTRRYTAPDKAPPAFLDSLDADKF